MESIEHYPRIQHSRTTPCNAIIIVQYTCQFVPISMTESHTFGKVCQLFGYFSVGFVNHLFPLGSPFYRISPKHILGRFDVL